MLIFMFVYAFVALVLAVIMFSYLRKKHAHTWAKVNAITEQLEQNGFIFDEEESSTEGTAGNADDAGDEERRYEGLI